MTMKRVLISLFLFLTFPSFALAATAKAPAPKFSFQAWVAYWDKASSTALATSYVNQLDEISPFSFTVESDGTIIDSMYLLKDPWPGLYAAAKNSKKKTKIIPSIAWFKGSEIHATLSDKAKRTAHVLDIIELVSRNNFDGIDIDYEGKLLESRAGFSAFIKDLGIGLHAKKKLLVCTIEARTPYADRKPNATDTPQYVNDYKVLAKYCDEVRLMTYDQQDDDRTLVSAKSVYAYYTPVADPDWVSKVVKLAAKEIPKNKLVIGIPTYGTIFKITLDKDGKQHITKMRSITYSEALTLASSKGIYPARGMAGERTFHYTKEGVEYAASFQDGESIRIKIANAKKLGVKGVALFKIDGKADQDFWKYIK